MPTAPITDSTGTHVSVRTPLGAWREVQATGSLPGDPHPDRTAAGLVSRWHQHLAVAMDVPLERQQPGRQRLPQLIQAWLDLTRRTEPVRRHVALTAGPRTAAERAQREAQLTALLAEDLTALGAPHPRRSAQDLLRELAQVADTEDAAGRPLPAQRATLLSGAGLTQDRRRFTCRPAAALLRRRRPLIPAS